MFLKQIKMEDVCDKHGVCFIYKIDLGNKDVCLDMNICAVAYSRKTAQEMESFIREEIEGAAECLPEEYRRRTVPDMVRIAVARMMMFLN